MTKARMSIDFPSTLGSLHQYLVKQMTQERSAELDARIIIQKRTGFDWSDIIARPEAQITSEELGLIQSDYVRHINGEPLSRIYGMREFWGMEFQISPDTLDPRADTETLIEAVLKSYDDNNAALQILDLGTGTGCILLALLKEFPNAKGFGVDLSQEALDIAQTNAKLHALEERTQFMQSKWFDSIESQFDLIVSNPPYIESDVIANLEQNVKNYDPMLALDGGKDGLDAYQSIFSEIKNYLKSDGKGFFEIGYDQSEAVMRLIEKAGLRTNGSQADMAGNPRVVDIFF